MKQSQYSPMGIAAMAFTLFAVDKGYMDDLPVNKILDFESSMLAYLKSNNADLVNMIDETGDFNDDIAAQMKAALDAFKANGVW